ncbi:interleukin-22 receptor subunit alpha-1 isoform X1 [Terrapene carolina triunguis]|uniref:interleukin-22 receptor subunit alpha-1 isoform X1 n=1 Tax=Terrapene triunguis TaxID=2587831 RepID=UPI000CEF600D|nr:interleukin-22 receptor subunit alpha-1 isoform X1 [Terrapene carolina triunguis]
MTWKVPFNASSLVPLGCSIAERSPLLKHAAFSSTNFENIFKWESEADTPPGTVYEVQYKRYGDEDWLQKSECQNITQPFCNLTNETENFRERYYARVRAIVQNCCSSDWVCSQRFYPREDTTIGKPEVKYVPSVRSIKFFIQPPYTPLRDEDGSQLTVEDIYSRFDTIDYHVMLFSQKTHQEWEKNENNKEFEVSNLNPDTAYNVTIYLKHLEKRSQPRVFCVSTLPDTTWLLYCVGGITFATGSLFVVVCYVIYKYIKQRTARPKSLDFRGISAFQPLMLTVEHIISPINDLSKTTLYTPDVQLMPINLLQQTSLFHLQKTSYQQQANVLAFQPIIQPVSQADGFPSAYAPQIAQENLPCMLNKKPLALTYGVCIESPRCINRRNSQPDQMLQDISPERFVSGKLKTETPGERYCDENYKEQRPKLVERGLWESRDTDMTGSVFSMGPAQQLMLQTDCEEAKLHMPQQSLSLLKEGGNYRWQMAGLLPLLSSLTVDTNSVSEDGLPPSSSSPLLKSVCTCDDLPGECSTGQLMSLDALSYPENKRKPPDFQTTDVLPAAREPGCLELNAIAPHASSSIQNTDMLFTMLFRDLDLKVQWEHGQNENTLMC